jgi:hypothetical protein
MEICVTHPTKKGRGRSAPPQYSLKAMTIMPIAKAIPISQKEPVTNQSNHDIFAFIFWSPPVSEAQSCLSATSLPSSQTYRAIWLCCCSAKRNVAARVMLPSISMPCVHYILRRRSVNTSSVLKGLQVWYKRIAAALLQTRHGATIAAVIWASMVRALQA